MEAAAGCMHASDFRHSKDSAFRRSLSRMGNLGWLPFAATSNRAVQRVVRTRGLGTILFVLCIWFPSYDIAIRISDLIYAAKDEADYLNYVIATE